jgi:hypothetical protein
VGLTDGSVGPARLTLPPKRCGQLGEPMLPPKRRHWLGESAQPPKWHTAGSMSRWATEVARPTQPDGTHDQEAGTPNINELEDRPPLHPRQLRCAPSTYYGSTPRSRALPAGRIGALTMSNFFSLGSLAASSAGLIGTCGPHGVARAGVAPPRRSLVELTCPRTGRGAKIPKLKGFLIRRPDGFSKGPRLDAQGVRPGTARETYRLSCQRSLSHLTLMGFHPLQRIGQRKRPTPDSSSGCATLSGFLNLSAF